MVNIKHRGFTLLEVMIALFVLSVGMLGSSALMLRSQQEATATNHEAIATQLAQNMAEKLRANIVGVEAGEYDAFDSGAADPGCISTGCSAAGLALYDSYIWGWELGQYLPDGVGTVRGNGGDSVFTITVSWTQTERTEVDKGTVGTKNYVMIFQP